MELTEVVSFVPEIYNKLEDFGTEMFIRFKCSTFPNSIFFKTFSFNNYICKIIILN